MALPLYFSLTVTFLFPLLLTSSFLFSFCFFVFLFFLSAGYFLPRACRHGERSHGLGSAATDGGGEEGT